MERRRTDILILGSGGAGLFAAIHAHRKNSDLDITVAVKGLLGKSGCTRMVQGGYNVSVFTSLKTKLAVSLIAILMAAFIRRPLPVRPLTEPCTRVT